MQKRSIFELAYIVLISTVLLAIGLFEGIRDLSDFIVLLSLYFINVVSAIVISRSSVSRKNKFKFYFAALNIFFISILYLTQISLTLAYVFGVILITSSIFSLGLVYSFVVYLILNLIILINSDDITWLVAFVSLTLFTYIYLIYLQYVFNERTEEVSSKLSNAEIERERLVSLINSMGDGVIATDEKGKIILYNGASLDILDTNRTIENVNINDVITLHNQDGEGVDLLNEVRDKNGYLTSRDYRLVLNEDEFVNLYIAVSPVRLGYKNDSKMIGYIVVIRDITKEKSLEEERDEFISVVSHELRTPITIAEGNISNLQLILEGKGEEIDENLKTSIEDAHKQVVFLADMVNDLSTLSRSDRGVLKVEPVEIDVKELIESIVRDYTPDVKEKNLKFKYEVEDDLSLFTSQLYLREILQNFLTNAIKYTQEGFVKITAKGTENGVMFEVQDSGIGLSKSDQKKLFKKFFRSEDYRTRENSGTGLGLYVTLKLVKLLKAKIDVDSKLNEGSTFKLTVPNYDSES